MPIESIGSSSDSARSSSVNTYSPARTEQAASTFQAAKPEESSKAAKPQDGVAISEEAAGSSEKSGNKDQVEALYKELAAKEADSKETEKTENKEEDPVEADKKLQEEQKKLEEELQKKQAELEKNEELQKTLGDQIQDAVKNGDNEKAASLMQQLQGAAKEGQQLQGDIKDLANKIDGVKDQRQQIAPQVQQQQQQQQAAQNGGSAPACNNGGGGGGCNQGGGAAPAGGSGGGGNQGGGGGAAPAGGSGGSSPAGGSGGAAPAQNNGNISASETNPSKPINLEGDDKKTADFINKYLEDKDSPAAGTGAGEMMVKYGKENDVDPLILLSIAGLETQFGKTGIGVNGMLGVGAYDSDPNNATRNPVFSGVENQIKKGAETFARLREKGGASSDSSVAEQIRAARVGGWATDPEWHNKVTKMYGQVSAAAEQYQG